MSTGAKIIEGLKQAVEGEFARVTIEGQVWERIDAPPNRINRSPLSLDGTMTPREIMDTLAKIRFTASHGWARTIKLDADVRDLIVKMMLQTWGSSANAHPKQPRARTSP